MAVRLHKKFKLSVDVKYSRLEQDSYMYIFDASNANNLKKLAMSLQSFV
jgi:hypothetical protein